MAVTIEKNEAAEGRVCWRCDFVQWKPGKPILIQ